MNKNDSDNFVLEADHLHFAYQQKNTAPLTILQDVSLTLKAGESVAIVGASGSGKSTLLHLLGGLETPQQGVIKLCGQNFSNVNDNVRSKLRNQHLGFVYQFHHLLAEFSAQENVAMPLKIRGVDDNVAMNEAKILLEQVGLGERLTHKPSELSGGERQRAAIARALVHRPNCLLADEPTGNLDHDNAIAAFQLMRELITQQQGAMIIVTHDTHLAAQMDNCFYLKQGYLVQA
ncbi:ABC transporter ATP-binding protein [Dichelobacter nodosus]|uniref:Lipoprotein releasing system ATP-binding protein LolD n=1 Tax=Dichelobacter nodosus (strain VCS1703A) TaxID=246195 RepID=A5EXC5_DICNV|nr:ATP-binding cassette domain-containing protein [Dichelobacter nodosus]ABQ14073.1 lipoprotein releasing system ATP-binding protein LolD [Dichelobacter nodosus VCS1703A]AXM45995.1 lipoprotein ABC transporter ATP-binding protein LolD [Dichelobacter nodosus]KNZ39151.1 ABC transporter [Dichelobacter nodosus]TGA64553.1 ATP-binding cassette domain-containing protein [Dichelobacter nodosus]